MPSVGTVYKADFLSGVDLGNVTVETQFSNSRSKLAVVQVPSGGQFSNTRLIASLAGRVATTSNLTFTVALYFGISPTVASNTLMFSSGAQTVNNLKSNWHMDIDLFWDSDSNTICGHGRGQMANSPIGPASLSAIISANPNAINTVGLSSTTYGFTCTGLFSGSSSGNHSFLDVFEVVRL